MDRFAKVDLHESAGTHRMTVSSAVFTDGTEDETAPVPLVLDLYDLKAAIYRKLRLARPASLL